LDYRNGKNHIYPGQDIRVQTFKGHRGEAIGRLLDGRAILFKMDSPYKNMINPYQLVDCRVVHVSQMYIIVDPIREPEPFKSEKMHSGEPKPIENLEYQEVYEEPLLQDLRILSEKGEWETGILARALLYIIEMFDYFKGELSERSSLDKDSSVEEQPVEASSIPDEFLRDSSYLESEQFHVKESKAPESDFLRYLEEEGRKDNYILSTTIENFGSVVDLPKDVRLLTMVQTRSLKEHHLKDLDGYDKIERFSNFFVEPSALKRGEYGNLFYASTGTNPWNKVYKITVQRDQG